jgi:hypothetical protein
MFAFDAFEPALTMWQAMGHFLIHLLPSFVLCTLLLIAWRHEKTGGLLLMLTGLALSPFVFRLNYERNHFTLSNSLLVVLIINMPFVLAGLLFIVSDRLWKRAR